MANEETQQSPWTRPSFLMAGALVMLLVIAGVVLSIIFTLGGNDDADSNSSKPATTAAPTPDEGEASGSSVCGLDGDVLEEARLSKAPEVDEWEYAGTSAYPISEKYGPGANDPAGFNYCFQRSPEGALFAATSIVPGTINLDTTRAWAEYVLAPGPYRDQLLTELANATEPEPGSSDEVRIRVSGFRLLSYTGETARVDLATQVSTGGDSAVISSVFELVWSDGDWKLSTETVEPFTVTPIPNMAGYVSWGE